MPDKLFDRLLMFNELRPEQRDVVRALFIPCAYETGDVIFEQGEPCEYLYLVVEGEVTVRFKPDDGPALTVARARSQGVVGWSAALGSPSYTSSAICSTQTQLMRISGQDLRHLCEQHPDTGRVVLERLATVIAERLRNTYDQVMLLLEQGLHVQAHV